MWMTCTSAPSGRARWIRHRTLVPESAGGNGTPGGVGAPRGRHRWPAAREASPLPLRAAAPKSSSPCSSGNVACCGPPPHGGRGGGSRRSRAPAVRRVQQLGAGRTEGIRGPHPRMRSSTSSRFSSMCAREMSDSRLRRSRGSVFEGRTLKCQSSKSTDTPSSHATLAAE
jgi:hypothetical protein